jgi:hypothetical protein
MNKRINVGKAIVFALIVMFIGTSFLPSITANTNKSSMDDFTITIIKPKNAIYKNNQELITFLIPIILRGNIDINIEISPPTTLTMLEILVNDNVVDIIKGPGPLENPIITLGGNAFSKVKIGVVGYSGSIHSSDSIILWRIFP